MKKLNFLLLLLIIGGYSCSNKPEHIKIEGSGFTQPPTVPTSDWPYQMDLSSLSAFQNPGDIWQIVGDIPASMSDQSMKSSAGTGILLNTERSANIASKLEHGDIEMEMEFLLPKGGAAGVMFQGRYEIQLKDSWGQDASEESSGAIFKKHAPSANAAKAPGLWQKLRVAFRAPIIDETGNKVRDAIFEEVWLNDIKVHNIIKVDSPTEGALYQDEQPMGPLVIQGDEGQIAVRNISYNIFDGKAGSANRDLDEINYSYYELEDGRSKVGDLDQLTPKKQGTISDFNIYAIAERDVDYAIKFEADMDIPQAGNYVFFTTSDDGSFLYIDGKKLVDNDGTHAPEEKRGRVALTEGTHKLRVDFFQKGGGAALQVHYRGPGIDKNPINKPIADNTVGAVTLLVEPEEEAYLLRSFVPFKDGKRTHCLSVGTPEGIHYNLDLNQGAWLQAWRGNFVDVSQMWVARGIEQIAIPQGSGINFSGKPGFAMLENKQSIWPDSLDEESLILRHYDLDDRGLPTINYELDGGSIVDQIIPDGNGLTRSLELSRGQFARIASGRSILQLEDGSFNIDGQYFLRINNASGKVLIREFDDLQEILIAGGKVNYSIIW